MFGRRFAYQNQNAGRGEDWTPPWLHREEEWRWFLLLFLTIAIRKGLTSFYERRAA